jgi:hypothetical protein
MTNLLILTGLLSMLFRLSMPNLLILISLLSLMVLLSMISLLSLMVLLIMIGVASILSNYNELLYNNSMSLDKSIQSGKERRAQYRKSKRFDRSCRNHGSCPWCEGNRTIQLKRELERVYDNDDSESDFSAEGTFLNSESSEKTAEN